MGLTWINDRNIPRTTYVAWLLGSEEGRKHKIITFYQTLLNRTPTPDELNSVFQWMQDGATDVQIMAAITSFAEFTSRLG